MQETLQITNYNPYPMTLNLLYDFGADFADIFDIRGYERERFGSTHSTEVGERSLHFRYTGIDHKERDTRITFDRKPDYLDPATALFRITVPSRESIDLELGISVQDGAPAPVTAPLDRLEEVAGRARAWLRECTTITTGHAGVNRALIQSLRDVRMLWSKTDAGEGYPAAGTPWFDAFFGRDSCIVSLQMMAYRPQIARDSLRLAREYQGTRVDHARDEEPGKILHELRFDELSRSGELPYGPYYGSIDSTPLFLMLVAEYHDWTADDALMIELLPAIKAALGWMRTFGDLRGDRLPRLRKALRQRARQPGLEGLLGRCHARRRQPCAAPIALAEVQGYAYAARVRMARVFDRIGDPAAAEELRRDAAGSRRRFNHDFWMDDLAYYALAVDGADQPARSIASMPRTVSGPASSTTTSAADVVRTLMSRAHVQWLGHSHACRGHAALQPDRLSPRHDLAARQQHRGDGPQDLRIHRRTQRARNRAVRSSVLVPVFPPAGALRWSEARPLQPSGSLSGCLPAAVVGRRHPPLRAARHARPEALRAGISVAHRRA